MRGALALGLVCCGCLTAPAGAADVNFSGTLLGLCSVALTTPGVLALSADGTIFGSEEIGGLPAAVTILAVGSYTVTINAPTRIASPGGYDPTGESIEVSYSGLAGLGLINQAYTTGLTTFPIDTLPLSTLVMNNRITNPTGFAAGTYETRTVVTCS
jgi:hypothetical protein